jgi:hypothetical protein
LLGFLALLNATAQPASLFISSDHQEAAAKKLMTTFGADQEKRIRQGLRQVATFWQAEDGAPEAFETFCLEHFASDPAVLQESFKRFERNFESIRGYFSQITRDLKEPLDVDRGEKLPIDDFFAKVSPEDHLQEDLFKTKLAFFALLNFRQTNLDEKLAEGPNWTREEWARTRLNDYFPARVPASINQILNSADIDSESFVNDYNIMADYLLTPEKKQVFKEELKLISHWGLRDHLKLMYSQPDGLAAQELLYQVMTRIIDQTIPKSVVNAKTYWDPVANKTYTKTGETFSETPVEPAQTTRYERMLANFQAQRQADPFYPNYPTFIDRKFKLARQIPETVVEKLLVDLLSTPIAPKVGALVSTRLGRALRPFDIWYQGFKAAGGIPEKEMNAKVQAKYPNLEAFQKDIPNILTFLGFMEEKAKFLSERIVVDPARGGGHAMPPMMRSDKARLRTRVPKGGMDYQGFNTGMHELGHNVEQVFSLFKSDSYLMADVPNTALTEAFAFVFQDRDLELLGIKNSDPKAADWATLDVFWATFEIAGVSLVDLKVWRWLYANPTATPAQLRDQVIAISKEVWNTYYAPVFGVKDSPILAVYSHMIAYPLYLADYTVGGVVQYQIADFLKGKNLGTEMERMCTQGYLTPKQWMEGAVGKDISADALIKAATEALAHVQ